MFAKVNEDTKFFTFYSWCGDELSFSRFICELEGGILSAKFWTTWIAENILFMRTVIARFRILSLIPWYNRIFIANRIVYGIITATVAPMQKNKGIIREVCFFKLLSFSKERKDYFTKNSRKVIRKERRIDIFISSQIYILYFFIV